MISKYKDRRGFTIVELLIVIVVIGILAALVVTTYTGIQKKARDTERKTDINAIHGQVEAYQAQNGKYPTLANLNDQVAGGFVATNLKGLDLAAFKDPNGTSNNLANAAAANVYSYVATPAACDNTPANGDCTAYTLTATLEDGTPLYVKSSLN